MSNWYEQPNNIDALKAMLRIEGLRWGFIKRSTGMDVDQQVGDLLEKFIEECGTLALYPDRNHALRVLAQWINVLIDRGGFYPPYSVAISLPRRSPDGTTSRITRFIRIPASYSFDARASILSDAFREAYKDFAELYPHLTSSSVDSERANLGITFREARLVGVNRSRDFYGVYRWIGRVHMPEYRLVPMAENVIKPSGMNFQSLYARQAYIDKRCIIAIKADGKPLEIREIKD